MGWGPSVISVDDDTKAGNESPINNPLFETQNHRQHKVLNMWRPVRRTLGPRCVMRPYRSIVVSFEMNMAVSHPVCEGISKSASRTL